MKKVGLALLLAMALVGCSEEETTNKETADKPKEETKMEEQVNENSEESGVTQMEGMGKVTTVGVGYNDEIDAGDTPKTIKMGPMELTINGVHVLRIETDEDGKQLYFDGKEEAMAILVDMKASNTSDSDVTFHPNQAIITTDTGEQVESDIMLMGEAGGDFLGKVEKEGQTWWLLKNVDKEIKKITMVISPPSNMETWDDLAEEQRIEFEVVDWEEAKKREGM